MAKLSVIIPSRDEQFLIPTIDDIFRNARGEIEVIAVLDSDKWPAGWKEVTDRHVNLHTIHNGRSLGMRASINRGVASAISRGAKFIMKSDGHCSFSEGFDEVLKSECEPNWVVVPRRGRLDPENWTATETHKPDIDYHYLSFPDNPQDWGGPGLNGKPWSERAVERKDILIDDEMSSQGSCWFTHADYFTELELMDDASYGPFWCEFQEIGLKCWLSGGEVKVNKRAKYLHLHKGSKYGRGYRLQESALQQGRKHTMLWPWNEAWAKQTLPFKWLIEKFHPVPSWPDNWEEILYATRKPRVVGMGSMDTAVPDGSRTNNSLGDAGLKTHLHTWLPAEGLSDRAVSLGREALSKAGLLETSRLRIHKAHYGIGSLEDIDVTRHLQSLVTNDSLDIVVNNSTLTPDSNPFRGKKKQLNVTYSFDGAIESVTRTVEEKDWLIIGLSTREVAVQSDTYVQSARVVVTPIETDPTAKEFSGYGSTVGLVNRFEPPIVDDDDPRLKTADYLLRTDGEKFKVVPNTGKTMTDPPRTAPALNDYLIRKFSISPQRLRGPMPIELRDFHRNDLAQLFAELGFKRGAEIGVAEGNYSEVLLKANPECELLLVDPWHAYAGNPQNKPNDKHEFAYNEVVRKTKDYPHVDIRQGYSMDVVDGIMLGELDFVYIDACHLFDDCVMDIIEWSKRVRSGGIVSGDDYYQLDQKRWVGGGVVEAVQAYVNAHRIPVWWIFQGHKSTDYMWVKP